MNGTPFVHTTHWKEQAISFEGAEPARYEQKEGKFKLRCEKCGSPIGTWSSKTDEYSIWPSTLNRDRSGKPIGLDLMKPTGHIFYDTRVIDIDDGLPKWDEYEIKAEGKLEK
ncbi:Mss4-like [Phaffia rhodozyma]|uniref:Mss4-like n=1 Tax=Phaffia rhodozyma TaxID=264483 RepID=A0A0F7SNT4_PHARH|nr:Mss4-like [Phaffia rhodozyma]